MTGIDTRGMLISIVLGIVVIFYAALGVGYLNQTVKQRQLSAETAKLAKALPAPPTGGERLKTDYDEASRSLAPLTVEAVIGILVSAASASGIDTKPESKKFDIPAQRRTREEKVAEGKYQVISVTNIHVQGKYENVMTFITSLNSGSVLKALVLKRLDIQDVDVVPVPRPAPQTGTAKETRPQTDTEVETAAQGKPAAQTGTAKDNRPQTETAATLDLDVYCRPK